MPRPCLTLEDPDGAHGKAITAVTASSSISVKADFGRLNHRMFIGSQGSAIRFASPVLRSRSRKNESETRAHRAFQVERPDRWRRQAARGHSSTWCSSLGGIPLLSAYLFHEPGWRAWASQWPHRASQSAGAPARSKSFAYAPASWSAAVLCRFPGSWAVSRSGFDHPRKPILPTERLRRGFDADLPSVERIAVGQPDRPQRQSCAWP